MDESLKWSSSLKYINFHINGTHKKTDGILLILS